MKIRVRSILIALIGLSLGGAWTATPAAAWAQAADCVSGSVGGYVQKLSHEFREWDGTEVETNVNPRLQGTGAELYHKLLTVPSNCDTLQVSLIATSDNNGLESAAPILFKLTIDGNAFPTSSTFGAFTPSLPGWIVLNQEGAIVSDQGISYTWCAPITPGTHFVQIWWGSGGGTDVFLEGEQFIISAENLGGSGCMQAAPPDDPLTLRGIIRKIPGLPAPGAPVPSVPAPPVPGLP